MTPFRKWSFLGLALLVGAVCIRLGLWQLARLEARRARNEAIASSLQLPRIDLNGGMVAVEALSYRRVSATGEFDPAYEVVLRPRSYNQVQGIYLITPLRLEGSNSAVLVNRGWVPDEFSQRPARLRYVVDGLVEVRGLALPSQEGAQFSFPADPQATSGNDALEDWLLLNVENIQAQVPYPLLPVYLAQSEKLDGLAIQPIPVADAELDISTGPHLGYAIQWFFFAGIALFGGALWHYRAASGKVPGPPPSELSGPGNTESNGRAPLIPPLNDRAPTHFPTDPP